MRFIIRAKPTTPQNALMLRRSVVKISSRPQRVLDFDIEARPLSWIGSDYVSKEVTAMAWAWTDQPDDVTCYALGETDTGEMLRRFVEAYNRADVVTGHFIRGFDLPTIQGALMECRLPPLSDKASHDTKLDLIRSSGISLSQESLGAMLRLEHDKVQMNQSKWRAANRLTPEGIAEAKQRVVGDVKQHIDLRRELLALGYLAPAVVWRSGSAKAEAYVP